jgi:DNA-binding HxlR family transcriptional regulator
MAPGGRRPSWVRSAVMPPARGLSATCQSPLTQCPPVSAELPDRGRRYQELHDTSDSTSYKVLSETLRWAKRDGLATRRLDPCRVETATLYELTDLDRLSSTVTIIAPAEWSEELAKVVREHRRLFGSWKMPPLQGTRSTS